MARRKKGSSSEVSNMDVLMAAIRAKKPVLLWGPPGIGKTAIIKQVAGKMDAHLETVLASIREPSDFGGLPAIIDGNVHLMPPVWARNLRKASDEGKTAILFLDEISTARPSVQSALLRVTHEKIVGDLYLGDNVSIVAAANPPDSAAGGWELPLATSNRWCHLEWKVDAPSWNTWFKIYGEGDPKVKAVVSSFIHRRPTVLHQMPKDDQIEKNAWPSPRSWESTSSLLSVFLQNTGELTIEQAAKVAESTVGQAVAGEFAQFIREVDLPDPELLLAKPDEWEVPEQPDRAFAALSAVVSAVSARPTEKRWSSLWKVVVRGASLHKDVATGIVSEMLSDMFGVLKDCSRPPEDDQLQVFASFLKSVFPEMNKKG